MKKRNKNHGYHICTATHQQYHRLHRLQSNKLTPFIVVDDCEIIFTLMREPAFINRSYHTIYK